MLGREEAAGGFAQGGLIQLVDAVVALRTGGHQSRLGQFGQVVRDGGGFQVEQGRQFLDAVGALGQQTDDLQAAGIRQGFEEGDQFRAHWGRQYFEPSRSRRSMAASTR